MCAGSGVFHYAMYLCPLVLLELVQACSCLTLPRLRDVPSSSGMASSKLVAPPCLIVGLEFSWFCGDFIASSEGAANPASVPLESLI